MDHRVKNLFAIASGMVTMTARNAPSVQDMASTLTGRLHALAKAHELIRSAVVGDTVKAQGASLRPLLQEVVKPHLDPNNPSQLTMRGPEVLLGPSGSTSLALIFHELATNAAKYGALSSPTGKISIEWKADHSELEIGWKEQLASGEIKPPTQRGFGSKLSHSSATGQLGGSISFDWRPSGVHVCLKAPLAQIRR
jgi:two-component sensor histidine kinase